MSRLTVVAVLILLLLSCTTGFARDWFVSPTGSDGGDGTIGAPLQNLDNALSKVAAGDVIQMRAGTFPNGVYRFYVNGTPTQHITVRSYDGDYAANQDAGVFLGASSYIDFEGIDFSVANGHCINTCGESTGYQQFNYSHHITYTRCKFHERDTDNQAGGDEVVKCAQARYLTFEDCEISVDNGTYTNTSFALDWVNVRYSTMRRMYLHDHNGAAIYTKGGSQYNVLEQSVLAGDRPTSYGAGIQTGDGTGLDFCDPDCEWESEYYVVRNNVIRWGTRAAFYVSCVHALYAYNNLLIDCGDSNQTIYPGIRAYIALWAAENSGEHMNGRADLIRFYNNIFYDTAGDMGPAFGYNVGSGTDWARGNNNYYNNGNAIPASTLTIDGVLLDPSTESGATIGNPDLNNATGTATTRQGWIDLFRPKWTTQSNNMLREKGSATAGNAPYPSVINDIEGWPRPCDGSWEIGPFEYHGTLPPPNAVFGGAPTTGVVPLAVQFTDGSWGAPTSWSWTFGDGNTSTVQSPSHTYTSVNSFTVSLTVQSSQGSDSETKTNYIVTLPIDAKFTNSRAFGQAPWTVNFTDTSIGVATAWSWTFGDGGTATTQNPSHTYTVNGIYGVSLTATSAYGSDTETKPGLVTICDPVVVYPTSYLINYPDGGNQHVVSGSLSDLQTANDVAFVIAADTLNPLPNHPNENRHYVYFSAATAYTPAQVAGVTSAVRVKVDYANAICDNLILACPHGCAVFPFPATYTDYTADNGSIGANGTVGYTSCGLVHNATLQAYSFHFDKVCWYVFVKPTGGAPVANFSGTPTTGTAPLAVNFTDTSTNTPTAWSWNFGDSTTSTAENPSHTYASTGTYTVSLRATNAAGYDDEVKTNYISVTVAPPVAAFSGTPTTGTVPLAVSFTDASTNSPTAWSWNFGDGSTSTAQSPSHTFNSAGNYTVSLRATNAGGYDDEVKTNYITVNPAGQAPVANFTGTPTTGTAPLTVNFTDTSTNTPTAWSWSFGDSNTSTAQNPSHTYNVAGTYTVALTATNAFGNNTNTKTNYISVSGSGGGSVVFYPSSYANGSGTTTVSGSIADLQADDNVYMVHASPASGNGYHVEHFFATGYAPSQVARMTIEYRLKSSRDDTPKVSVYGYAPVYGQHTTFLADQYLTTAESTITWTTTNITNYFPSDGNVDIDLCGCGLVPSTAYQISYDQVKLTLELNQPAPVADFSATTTLGSAPLAVTFTDTSTNTPTAWSWTFGDGNSSAAQNPSHTYNAAGNYTVALTATNAGGSDGETKTNYITVGTEVTTYPNDYWMMDWRGATIVAGTLADVRSDNGLYHVSAPNGFNQDARRYKFTVAYAPADLASMTLECQFKSSRADVPQHDLAIRHLNNDTFETVLPAQLWGTTDRDIPAFTRTAVGEYVLADGQVWVDICGCPGSVVDPYQTSVDFIRLKLLVKPGTTISAPTANFTGTPTTGTAPLAVTFTDSSTGSPTFWAWEFGDATSSTVQSPSHTYNAAGNYSVTLTVNNGYGANTLTRSNYITVTNLVPPVANFTGAPTNGTAPLAVSFTDTSTNAPTSWSWAFGDGNTSTAQNPSHTYAVGTYTVTLTATNAAGSDGETKTNYITVTPPAPVANFSGTPTSGAYPLAVSFTDSSTNSPTAWSWNFGDSTTSTAQNPSHTYSSAGNYSVSLRATNAGGYDDEVKTNYITVTVPAPVANFTGTPTTGTAPLAVSFTDTSTNTPTAWSWTFGDGNSSAAQNPSHTFAAGTYTISLTASNAGGSDGETKTNYITATSVPPPAADFTADQTVGLAGLAVSFTDTSTNTPTAWSWTFGDSSSSAAQNPSHTYNAVGAYTVTLTATNAGGSDGETKTNYIAVCTEVTVYPNDYWMMDWRGATIVAGTLADVRNDNGLYHVSAPNGNNQDARRYKFTVAYAPANLAKMTLECQFKSSRDDVPLHDIAIRHLDDNTYETVVAPQLWGSTDRDITPFTRTAVGEYVLADGQVWTDICGCPNGNGNPYTTSVDVIRLKLWVKPGTTISAPTANFAGTPTTGYVPLSVTFTDSSTGSPTFWAWEFGDGTSSTVQSPSHSYETAGTYSVTLTVNNGYGSNSMTRSNYITANNLPPAPVANFSGTPTTGTAPLAVSFTDSSTNTPTSWSWDFGDSNTSTVQNPSHTYTAGTYTVSLTATNAGGSDGETKTNYITVTAAAPTYVATGAVASGTGAISPALPSGRATNDILLLFLETANQAISISNQNGGTWTQVTNSPQSVGTAGGSNGTRITVFWSRYNGTQGAPTTSDSGDHQLGRIIAIRGATTSGDPCNITAGNTEATVDTSGAVAGATTTVANTLVVAAIATSLPDANGTANFSSWANTDLSSLTERTDNTQNAGNGGGLGIATGVKASAGAYTTTAVTCGTATTKAMLSIAIKP